MKQESPGFSRGECQRLVGHRSKTKSIKAKTPSSSKRVPAHRVAKSYHVPESATVLP